MNISEIIKSNFEENNKVKLDRKKLFAILNKNNNSKSDNEWLNKKFKQYGVTKKDIPTLKRRMDIIPPSMAIAQAAKETGWGTSRFALEGNALFGQWTWSGEGLKPKDSEKNEGHKGLKKTGKAMTDSLDALQHLIVNKRGLQGIVRSPDILSSKVGAIGRYLYSNITGPNDSHTYLLDYAESETEKVLEKVNAFFKDDWPDYQTAVEDADLSLFKEYKPIKID